MRHSALPMSLHYIRLRVPATKLYNIVILRAPRYDAVGTKLTSRDDPLLSAYLGKADEVDAVSPERASALGGRLRRPRLDHITSSGSSFPAAPWLATISCMTLDIFLHCLKFPARQIELSSCSGNLGVRSDGRHVFQVDMNRFAAGFGQSDPNPRSARDPITTQGGALYDAQLRRG
jgi:hypothetical protein